MVFNQYKKKNDKVKAFKDGTELATKVCEEINASNPVEFSKFECNDQGFVFVKLSNEYLCEVAKSVIENGAIVPVLEVSNRKVVVDFSSPNIAKEMHVGHLRSTIMGETLCRIFEFLGDDVVR